MEPRLNRATSTTTSRLRIKSTIQLLKSPPLIGRACGQKLRRGMVTCVKAFDSCFETSCTLTVPSTQPTSASSQMLGVSVPRPKRECSKVASPRTTSSVRGARQAFTHPCVVIGSSCRRIIQRSSPWVTCIPTPTG